MIEGRIRLSEILYALAMIIIAVVYYWTAQIGFIFAWHHTNVTAVWPPSALGFIVILVLGKRFWPGIWLGAFITNTAFLFANPSYNVWQVVLSSGLIAVANTLEAVGGCYFLKKIISDRNPLKDVKNIFRFMIVAVVVTCVSSLIGSLVVFWGNNQLLESYVDIWITWWLGGFSGILTLVPVYWAVNLKPWPKRNLQRFVEFVFLLGSLVIINGMLFDGRTMMSQTHLPIMYLPLALTVLITYRLGYLGAITSILITVFQDIQGTNHGFGPFVTKDLNHSLLLLQTFIDTLAGTTLLLAAAIYERREAQQEVTQREKLFRALVENSLDMKMLLNTSGVITYSSPSTEKILGYSREEHEGKNIFSFIHPDDENRIIGEFSKIISQPLMVVTATARIKHKNGSWRWVEGTGRNLLLDPAIRAVVVNYRDITDRRNTERIIKTNEERLRQIIDLVPHFIFAKDIEGRFILVNQAVAEAYGTSVEHLTGKTDADFSKSEAEVMHFRKDDLEVLRLGKAKFIPEESITDAQGKVRLLSTAKIPFKASGVELPCILGVSVDITELKKAEEILKNDLKHATRLADIGTLAAIVAHELRTPLGVIQMAAHNLKNKNKQLSDDKHLENIQKKVWEGNRIIDNLLNYSRIKTPSYSPCVILNLLEECVTTVGNQFYDKGILVERNYQINKELSIDIDANQLREVLLNIISNAYQAVTDHEGKIVVTIQRQEPDFLNIIIQDNGIGIDSADLDKVFFPFFTTKAKGTGLGLAICNEIINLHHGRIDIQSIKGQGTSVLIVLPLYRTISI